MSESKRDFLITSGKFLIAALSGAIIGIIAKKFGVYPQWLVDAIHQWTTQ
jgi:hypothetical protein